MHFFHAKSLNLLFASGVWQHWYEFMFRLCAHSHNGSETFFHLDMQTWMLFGMRDGHTCASSCLLMAGMPHSMHNSMPPFLSQPVVTGNRRAAGQEPAEWGDGAGYGRLLWLPGTGTNDWVIGFTPPPGNSHVPYMSPKEGPSQKEISSSKHWIFKGYVSFRGPRINLVIHFGIHVWLKYLGWIEQCLCDGLRWLGMIECLTRELVIGLVQNDWVDEWKICWEMVAVRIWSVTSRFSCGPSLLADCYLKLPTTVLVHMVFQYYSSHIYI